MVWVKKEREKRKEKEGQLSWSPVCFSFMVCFSRQWISWAATIWGGEGAKRAAYKSTDTIVESWKNTYQRCLFRPCGRTNYSWCFLNIDTSLFAPVLAVPFSAIADNESKQTKTGDRNWGKAISMERREGKTEELDTSNGPKIERALWNRRQEYMHLYTCVRKKVKERNPIVQLTSQSTRTRRVPCMWLLRVMISFK